MTKISLSIWYWSVTIMPITAILTFILTLVVCNSVPNNAPAGEKFPQISQLGTGEAHIYFIIGFVILLPQLLIILIGRIQFFVQSQELVNRIILYIIHGIALISSIFMLIMAIVSIDDRPNIHLTGAYGMFGCISLYCFLHTILVIYLFIRRSYAEQHSNIIWSIWFLICSLILITFFVIWLVTAAGIPEYIAAATPFLYFLGFIPQFWLQARTKGKLSKSTETMKFANDRLI